MNKIYLYDNTFLDLIKLIYNLIINNIKPYNIKNEDFFPNLLEEVVKLKLDINEKDIDLFVNKVSSNVFKILYYVFLSDDANKELIIYYFALNALKYNNVIYRRNLKCVNEALRISQYVSHECHKYKGFLRFTELENKVLFAEIEPVNDILFILSNHFVKRLKNEYWIIKDVKRGIFSIYNKKNFIIVSEDEFQIATNKISLDEAKMVDLWKTFYNTIGIKERKNDRCRQNFMPKRYWKHITEMRDLL